MTSHRSGRTTLTSYWLWADRRIRISYNSNLHVYRDVAFLKIDVLEPKGAALPSSPTGHISRVLKDWEKLAADRDYVGYAQQFLAPDASHQRCRTP